MLSKISNDTKATGLGVIAGGATLSQVDWGKLFGGDYAEIGKLVVAASLFLLGLVTNKISSKVTN